MIQITDKTKCMGCGACSQSCPKNCIEMKADSEGFLYPEVARDQCIDCKRCEQVCPVLNTSFVPKNGFPDAYLVYDTDPEWRKRSAAGGGFAAIAREFIERYNGVVFGAIYDDDYKVYHTMTDSVDGIKAIQKSKYVQSETRDAYRLAKEELRGGRYVLYSGTPCQIYGLKSYLGALAEDEKLLCVDLSCHGVPSPKVFRKYLDYLTRSENSALTSFAMRDKQFSKNLYTPSFKATFENGKTRWTTHKDDYFGRCFFGEVVNRPICYQCPFKTVWRAADITLGDCRYFRSFVPSEHDSLGVTLSYAHSEKGRRFLEENPKLRSYPIDAEASIKVNGGIYKCPKPHPRRQEFFERIDREPFEKVVDSIVPVKPLSTKEKVKEYMNRCGIRLEFLREKSRKQRLEKLLNNKIYPTALGERK